MDKDIIKNWFMGLQDQICSGLEELDGQGRFEEDPWERPGGGGGRSRVMVNGDLIEKGGVNFSAVYGETPEKILNALQLQQADFFATGVSIVLHPKSPMMPIIHMNVRYFEMSNGVNWFGGGIDVTPHYVVEDDARHFHRELKRICDQHHPDYYPRFKEWADDYFFIKHRNETRGIGGIFFDRLSADEHATREEIFEFVKDVGNLFVPVYRNLAEKNRHLPYGKQELEWQQVRRGRYVEFNLVLDKGTKFGLDTNGRTESILMSMPPHAEWHYKYQPSPDSREAATLQWLKKGVNWA